MSTVGVFIGQTRLITLRKLLDFHSAFSATESVVEVRAAPT